MTAQELSALQDNILKRIGYIQPKDAQESLTKKRGVLNFLEINDGSIALVEDGLWEHEEVEIIIRKLRAFYDLITPAEIKIMNAEVHQCAHCEKSFTVEDFYPVTHHPEKQHLVYNGGCTISGFCRSCVYKAPLHTPSIHPSKKGGGFVYLATLPHAYKIGCSRTPQARMRHLKPDYGHAQLVRAIPTHNMYAAETRLQSIFLHRCIGGEVFDLTPEDVNRIMEL
jgi:hypothetical protein